jgi:predicted outer membrane repeat protein
MKNHLAYLILFLLIISCKKEKNDPVRLDIPEAICESPELTDMTGAKLWGTGTPESCTQQALQTLINNGGKIICNCGNASFTLKLTSSLIIPNKEVMIDGKNLLTIDGQSAYRIFDKSPAASQSEGTLFALQNMNLVNGKATVKSDERGGAAIYGRSYGSLHIINVNFENNTGPLSASDDCGAVHSIVYKDIVFANCNFTNNKGANGGAVGTIGSAMSFINCNFENNQATGTVGTFDKGGSGGAIYVDGVDQNGSSNKYISICGCNFKNNTAGYQAGAVNIIFYENTGSYATINKSTFDSNTCNTDKGGACYVMNGDLSVTNATFSKNQSPVQGGGIWTYNVTASLVNCTFFRNNAVKGTDGLGGALIIGYPEALVTNCTFSENRAGNFASAIFNSGKLTLTNNLFYNNYVGTGYQSNPYGGAVINKETNLIVNDGNLQYPAAFSGQYGTATDYWITSNVLTADAQLGTLSDNGGPTLTMPLTKNSPAIGKGTATGAPATDQRGKTRKNPPDIGAFELVE